MMSTYTDTRRKTAEKIGQQVVACLRCGEPTPADTLAMHGGRCYPCFRADCRAPLPQVGRSKAAERIRAEIQAMGKRVPA